MKTSRYRVQVCSPIQIKNHQTRACVSSLTPSFNSPFKGNLRQGYNLSVVFQERFAFSHPVDPVSKTSFFPLINCQLNWTRGDLDLSDQVLILLVPPSHQIKIKSRHLRDPLWSSRLRCRDLQNGEAVNLVNFVNSANSVNSDIHLRDICTSD